MRHLVILGWLAFAGCATNLSPAGAAPPPAPQEAPVLLTALLPSGASPTGLTLRVENPTDAPATFSRAHTPFEGIKNGFLTVRAADGSEVAYAGPMVKRAPPGPDDDVTVAPGGATEVTFDLVPAWPVTTGDYTVVFAGGSVSRLPASAPVTLRVP